MNKNHLPLLCMLGVIASCTVYESEELENGMIQSDNIVLSDMELIASMGYDTTDVKTFEDSYLVSGGYVFFKDALEEYREMPKTKLNAYSSKLPLIGQKIHLTVEADMSDLNYNEDYVRTAIEQWNSLPDCNIMFSSNITTQPEEYETQARLEIRPEPFSLQCNEMITVAPLGVAGNAGIVAIKTSDRWWKAISDEQRRYAIMHALGHLIGLKDADETDDKVEGTYPWNDLFSIMKPSDEITSATASSYWSGFSVDDRNDIAMMYPLIPDSMSLTVSPESSALYVATKYEFSATYECAKALPNATYKLTIDYDDSSIDDIEKTSSNGKFEVELDEPGSFTAKVVLYGKDGKERASTEADYTVVSDEIIYPSINRIELGKPCRFTWEYNNPAYPDAHIEYSAKELYFDGGSSRNVTIREISNNETDITFHDYGKYEITASVVDGPSSLEDRVFTVLKLFRPDLAVIPDESIRDGSSIYAASGYRDLPEDTTATGEYTHAVLNYYMTMGDKPQLDERVYVEYALKYWQNTNRNPLFALHYLFIDHASSLTFQKGDSNRYDFESVKWIEHPDSARVGIYEITSIYPFYAAEYPPEDYIKLNK